MEGHPDMSRMDIESAMTEEETPCSDHNKPRFCHGLKTKAS